MKLSIIISIYNEEQVLNLFYQTLMDLLAKCDFDYELIFVNDGSIDASQEIIDTFSKDNKFVKSILFSKNFGHEAAMIAGIDYATGDALICMDGDLQHPPTMIPSIVDIFISDKVDIINMVRRNTKKNLFSSLFYKLLNKLCPYNIEANSSDFFLISKRIAWILRENYRERVRFLRGFIQIIGFKRIALEYDEGNRNAGKSKYSFRKLISLSVTAIATLSKMPLKAGIYIGFISIILSILLVIYSIIMKMIDQPVSGYTTIVVFLGFMFSIQFFILGVIGEYIGFLFDEQKKRPIYIVDKTTNF
ncbi:MAG: glycosyltransferase family 2 protein [Bacteroidales bacterium]|jgi:dolichol-phosphate mannosyltransferase|nr:glycosyltransferase family 2 protein [Bacteroidales bacterium]